MASSLICKLHHGTETRRFTAHTDTLTYASIAKRAKDILGLTSNFKLQYTDDEGDVITMSTEEEMAEAKQLALAAQPPVLRLSVVTDRKTKTSSTTTCDAAAPSVAAPDPADPLANLIKNIGDALPGLVEKLPPSVQQLMPRAELDVAATLAATAAANAAAAAGAAAVAPAANEQRGYENHVHPGVTCDRSGMCPIVGNRYHLRGRNYDLCESEFIKLSEEEKGNFEKIAPPFGWSKPEPPTPEPPKPDTAEPGVHWGVSCDRSGMFPIVGNRYQLKGHNYDLCESEYQKLSAEEKARYITIPPPYRCPGRGGWGGGWRKCGPFGGGGGGGGGGGNNPRLAARFIADVSIFDGTQMAPGTKFTKIWRIKNVGEIAWPQGTKMLFVGGDQMNAELQLPVRADNAPVQPGEEVDVAVDMIAPPEIGRYLGYWRLVGPFGRRKFGQRVWCHVQVVDPLAPPHGGLAADELNKAASEFSALLAKASEDNPEGAEEEDADGAEEEDAPADAKGATKPDAAPPALSSSPSGASDARKAAQLALDVTKRVAAVAMDVADVVTTAAAPTAAAIAASAMDAAHDMAVATAAATSRPASEAASSAFEEVEAPAKVSPAGDGEDPKGAVTNELISMGFEDEALIDAVISKHGADLEACTRELIKLSEWDAMLDDLEEMGFEDRGLNKRLMVKHDGSVKRTVKELVAEADMM